MLNNFYQCIILMVHDHATDMSLSVFYILASKKTQNVYWNVLQAVISAADEPESVVCDFEAGLLNAVVVQFPEKRVV